MINKTTTYLIRASTRLAMVVLAVVMLLPLQGGMSRVWAAELVMFESSACAWCEAWHNEVGVIYDKTPESRVLPLRRVNIHADRPADLKHIDGIIYTPIFVVLEDGEEIGRILGYPGDDFFWQLIGEIVKKVEIRQAKKS